MNRRPIGRWSAGRFHIGSGPIMVLAATLILVTGPGAASSGIRAHGQAVTSPEGQADLVGALAADLEYDPQKIFRYVSDQIAYQPYSGILRGARGTLDAQAGNSADKALLLGALFDASQISYRFARGPLDEATAATILQSLAMDVPGAKAVAQAPLQRGAEEVAGPGTSAAAASGPLAAWYDQQAEKVAADGAERFATAKSRLDGTVKSIQDALAGAGIQLSTASGLGLPPGETSNHTWVQMANGATWVDLDPTLPGAVSGAVMTRAVETRNQLPDDLRYSVEFDVIVERSSGGQLVTDNPLSYTGFADELAGVPISFGHVTVSGLKGLGAAISSLFGDGWLDYRPTLQVGTRFFFADESVAFPLASPGGGIFGEQPTPGASPGVVDGEATAEWLEVHITGPDNEPTVARRTIFDRLPADRRDDGKRSLDAVTPIELVDLDGTGTPDYPPLRGADAFAIATGPTSVIPAFGDAVDAIGSLASVYYTVRDAIGADMALDEGARTFIDAPNVVSYSIRYGGNDPSAGARVGLDIWHRSHGTLPLTGQSLSASSSRLVAGVMDQVAERYAVDALASQPGAPRSTIGVGEVFDAAAADGIPNIVIHGSPPPSLPYGPEANQLIEQALASGEVVVVPAKPVVLGDAPRIGWWTIDPGSGDTTDVMDDGAGPELAENETIIQTRLGAVRCYGALGRQAALEIAWQVANKLYLRSLGSSSLYRYWRNQVPGTSCG